METVIVGVGNELREDDGVGVAIVTGLAATGLNRCTDLLLLGNHLFYLPKVVVGYRRVVVIDALPPEGNPGRVVVFSGDKLRFGDPAPVSLTFTLELRAKHKMVTANRENAIFTLHDLDLLWQLRLLQTKTTCTVWVVGIEAGSVGWRLGLSPILQRQFTELVTVIEKVVTELILLD